MKSHVACQTTVVARSEYCFVTQCPECDMFHIHIGPMSLRLKSEVFEGICETLFSIFQQGDNRLHQYDQSMHSH